MSKPELFPGVPMPEHPRYTVIEKLAQGDYATVFRARDGELHREVAIKQIHAQYLEDPRQLEVYWREAQLIASLEHPRIMTIYDIVRERGWLILELMMGNITHVLKGRPIDLTDLRYLLKAVAQGLQFLERNGIIHGDVKPSNMLVDRNRLIKLGDFGIARRLSRGEGSVVKGTAKYMAPEVVSDQFGDVGPHSDLYSLGFSAYELMCGQNFESLFPGLTMFGRDQQIAWMMWQSAPDRRLPQISRVLQNVPDDLTHIVEKLCEKDPAKRYRTAEEVLRDLDEDKTRERKPTAQEAAEAAQAASQARRKRLLAVGALAVSLLLSVVVALLPSGSKVEPPPPPQVEPATGSLVLIDLPNRRLQLQTAAGPIVEVPLDQQRDTIVLNAKELMSPGELKLGDQVEAVPVLADGKVVQRRFAVTRAEAVETRGTVAEVGVASQTVTIMPPGDGGEALQIFIPSTVELLLNGEAVSLAAIQPGDRIVATYLPENDRLQAATVDAQRLVEMQGFIEAIRLPSQVTVRLPDASTVDRTVDTECQVVLNGRSADGEGKVFSLADLRKDDRVSLQVDRTVRRIEAQRVTKVTGIVERADPQTQQIRILQNDGRPRTLSLHEDCTVQLTDGEPVDFAELRADDTVTVVEDSQDGRARSIEVVFAPDRDVWAVVIAQTRYDDRRMTPSEVALPAAELMRRTLSRRVRVVDEQLLWLLDATRFGIEKPLSAFLARMPATGRLIVYFAGHATKNEAGEAFLAARDFDSARPKETGLNLANLLKLMDAAGEAGEASGTRPSSRAPGGSEANRKVLLFDVQHGGQDRAWQPSAEELVEALKARQGTVSYSVSVIGNSSRGQLDLRVADAEVGLFAAAVAAAYQGKATRGDDQRVTPQNLFKYLRIEIPTAALRAGQEQMPVLFEPTPDRFSPDQRGALLELASQLQADRRMDDGFALSFHQAAALVPDQPDAQLIYAMQLLQDRTRSKLALERFEQVAAKFPDHPNTVLAYHALAWLHFRSQNYDRGLQNLAQAVSLAPGADHPYSRHLFAFAGQLSGFARWAEADEKLHATRIPEVLESVTAQGKLAQQTFRETWEELHSKVKQRELEIQQATGAGERATLELQKKNINVYTTFDSAAAIAYLRELLESPR